jgi:hypothetical protein
MRSKAEALEAQPRLMGAVKYAGHQMLLNLARINLSGKE